LVIVFFVDFNIFFNLSYPSNHSQTLTNFTLNKPTFTFNPLKVNNTNFTLYSTWIHHLPLPPINFEGERGWRKERGRKRDTLLFLNHLYHVLVWGWYQDYNYICNLFFNLIMTFQIILQKLLMTKIWKLL